jgi:hypothetical protein
MRYRHWFYFFILFILPYSGLARIQPAQYGLTVFPDSIELVKGDLR